MNHYNSGNIHLCIRHYMNQNMNLNMMWSMISHSHRSNCHCNLRENLLRKHLHWL